MRLARFPPWPCIARLAEAAWRSYPYAHGVCQLQPPSSTTCPCSMQPPRCLHHVWDGQVMCTTVPCSATSSDVHTSLGLVGFMLHKKGVGILRYVNIHEVCASVWPYAAVQAWQGQHLLNIGCHSNLYIATGVNKCLSTWSFQTNWTLHVRSGWTSQILVTSIKTRCAWKQGGDMDGSWCTEAESYV